MLFMNNEVKFRACISGLSWWIVMFILQQVVLSGRFWFNCFRCTERFDYLMLFNNISSLESFYIIIMTYFEYYMIKTINTNDSFHIKNNNRQSTARRIFCICLTLKHTLHKRISNWICALLIPTICNKHNRIFNVL